MTLANFMMSSEMHDKLRRQSNFVENLVPNELYKIQEVQCCLEYINRERSSSRTIAVYSDEHGNKYLFLKLRGERKELMKYQNKVPAHSSGAE